MSTLTRPHRLLTLTEYEGALERLKRHPQKPWWFMAAFYGLMFAVVGSAPLSKSLFGQDDLRWWAVLILPSIVAVIGLPFLFAFLRRITALPNRYPELICPQCQHKLNKTAVRLSGHCSSCGTHVVQLPAAPMPQLLGDVDLLRGQHQRDAILAMSVMFGPMLVVTLIGAAVWVLGFHTAVAVVALPLALTAIVVGITWLLIRELWSPSGFHCPRCAWKPNSDASMTQWLLATGKCPGCGCQCYSRRNVPWCPSDQKLTRTLIREQRDRRGKEMLWFLGALLVLQFPLMWLCTRTAWWSAFGWLALLSVFPILFHSVNKTERATRCPACRKGSLASPIAIATGCCTHCGAEVLE